MPLNTAIMKVGKPVSKRVTVRLRHKIQKSSSAKQKKERRSAKKDVTWTSRLKKDPGIPKSFPFRDQVLAEVEDTKRRREEEQMAKREAAKARRAGTAVADEGVGSAGAAANGVVDGEDTEDGDEEMEDKGGNPMAALLASAQARAQDFGTDDDDEDDEDEDADDAWNGIDDTTSAPTQPTKKTLPPQAVADPVKTVSTLMEKMKETQDGIQRLIDYYQTPPLAAGSTDVATRFLVEVARKRGRLGRGGVPNLYSAAMLVLNDLNEERLKLPEVKSTRKSNATAAGKDEITIVQTMAEPFKLEGLFGGKNKPSAVGEAMEVET
ncbi:nuclear GTP-binding protein nug1 [Oleoguttula sp. CCFEE 5521]